MVKRAIKVIKQGEPEPVQETVIPEVSESELEAERRSTVKEWIEEYRENDRIEKAEDKEELRHLRESTEL